MTAHTKSSASKDSAILLSAVRKEFGPRTALKGVSFDLERGAFLSVFGPNGAGKTTLLRIVSTLARPTSGEVRVLGRSVQDEADAIRGEIGYVSHNPMLYPDLTAQENLLFFGRLYGVPDCEHRVAEMLETVGMLHRGNDVMRGFSRGMMQRVAIARALMSDPQLMLLDEPYAGLDPNAMETLDTLIERQRAGRTFLMVSHDIDKGYALCTHMLVLVSGHVAYFGPKEGLGIDAVRALYGEPDMKAAR